LAKLGTKVIFVGNLGQDEFGDDMSKLLQSRGIDLSSVARTDHPTRDVLVTRTEGGERTFAGFGKAKANEYSDCFIDPECLPVEALQGADLLVTGTLGLAYPMTAAAMHRSVELARSSGKCQVLVDVNWRPVFFDDEAKAKETITPYVLEADMVKVTEDEAEWLFDIPGSVALSMPERVLECLPKAKGVLVTAGGEGSAYAFKGPDGKADLRGRVPVLKVDVMDTTGAGDGFLGGFLHHTVKKGGLKALASNPEELRKAVEFGTACGAFVTQGPGAIEPQPTEADIAQFLSKNWDFDIPPAEYFDLQT
jgi:fructokinase